jgi:acyl-CoA thioester hydrolase
MNNFRFYYPIEVRYGDLDPQGHVNNAKFITYIEQARIAYVKHLGLWDGGSFRNIGIILADVQLTYIAPILWAQKIRVGVRVNRLGNKSFDFIYVVEDTQTKVLHATGKTVQVAYDYANSQTIPISDHWRKTIIEFEGL